MKLIENVNLDNDLFVNRNNESLVLSNDQATSFYDCSYKTDFTNIGFRLAYFLWIMRGSNLLDNLNYYSKHVDKMTDNNINLRGAYGPRLRMWVGADQLQESIKANQDVDEEECTKPQGVNQLEKVYDDLKGGMISSCCQIFDPSIDFDNSNDIPELSTMNFVFQKDLQMNALFTSATLNGHFINDYFFLSLLHSCMANMLGTKTGRLNVIISNANSVLMSVPQMRAPHCSLEVEHIMPDNTNPESLLKDIYSLCDFEKHLRNSVTKESIMIPTVNILPLCEKIMSKTVDATATSCQFWKDYAYTMFASVLIKEDKERFKEYIVDQILPKIKGRFKDEIRMELH